MPTVKEIKIINQNDDYHLEIQVFEICQLGVFLDEIAAQKKRFKNGQLMDQSLTLSALQFVTWHGFGLNRSFKGLTPIEIAYQLFQTMSRDHLPIQAESVADLLSNNSISSHIEIDGSFFHREVYPNEISA